MSFYWCRMLPQALMLLLRGPQSTYSTSQIKDLESHWESNQNPFWGVPFPASQWAALSAVQSEIELLYTPLLLLNRKNPWIFSKSRSSENWQSCRFNGCKQIWACVDEGSCRELFKYKLLSTDFYVGARSEVGWATFELTTEKIVKQYAIETQPSIQTTARSLWERYKGFHALLKADR